jgi:glycosyltransferase involved in cell wall biosynthesis
MWHGRTLALVLPTYNEAASIADCIRGFEALGIVDRIVVVNNNAHPDTSPEVERTGAEEVLEPTQGYGAAIRRGLLETSDADIVCVCEPDGTFAPDDLLKLLAYLGDVEVVFGSRTVQMFILRGANMGFFLRWGNWVVAKLAEVLFNTVYLSDVGCTFRVLTRRAVDEILPSLTRDGSAFGFDMMLEVIRRRIPFVQLPVKYLPRVGTSSVTGDPLKTLALGSQMVVTCLQRRLQPTPPRWAAQPALSARQIAG